MPSKPVTRAEHERLKTEHAKLMADVAILREATRQLGIDLQTQFKRIAEMQAILDEQRIADDRRNPGSHSHDKR